MQNTAFMTQLSRQFAKLEPYLPCSNELNLRHLRHEAMLALNNIGLPHKKQDTWKYTSLAPLAEIPFKVYTHPSSALSLSLLKPFIINDDKDNVLVFLNGYHLPALSHTNDACHGLTLTHFKHVAKMQPELLHELIAKGHTSKQFFQQMNSAFTTDGALVIIAENKTIKHPIHLYHFLVNPSQHPTMASTQTHIFVEKNAHATLIEHFITLSDQTVCLNTQTFIHGYKGAALTYTKNAHHDKNAYSVNLLQANLYAASLTLFDIGVGGKYQRQENQIYFHEKDSKLKVSGMMVPFSHEHIDWVYHVHHQIPLCESIINLKSLVGEKGHSSFLGKISVAQNAQKTITNIQNKNMLIGKVGIADSLPQFEILADDVQCVHGSSVSQLDENQLYYLQSRGLDEIQAKELMIKAFVEDVFHHLEHNIKEQVMAYIQRQI